MKKVLKSVGIAALLLGSIATASPTYAAAKSKPDMMGMSMMKGGKMDGMMADMNKMMKLCMKMMKMMKSMESMNSHHMKG